MSRFHELFDGMLETVVVFNAFDSELPNVRVALNREALEEYVLGLERQNAELAAALERLLCAAQELREVMQARGEDAYLSPPDDPLLWTARRNDAYGEFDNAIDACEDQAAILSTHDAQVSAAARKPLLEALREYRDALLNEEDTLDGPDGSPLPNWAMQASLLLNRILDKHEVEIEDYNEDGTEKSDGR